MCDVFFGLYNPPPLDPRRPLHVLYMFIAMSTGRPGGKHLTETERRQFHLSNDKRHGFKCISYACTDGIP